MKIKWPTCVWACVEMIIFGGGLINAHMIIYTQQTLRRQGGRRPKLPKRNVCSIREFRRSQCKIKIVICEWFRWWWHLMLFTFASFCATEKSTNPPQQHHQLQAAFENAIFVDSLTGQHWNFFVIDTVFICQIFFYQQMTKWHNF